MSIPSLLSSNSAKPLQAASMAPNPPPLSSNQPAVHLDSETLQKLLAPDLLIPHLHTSLPTFSFQCPPQYLSYTLPNLSSSASSSSASASSSTASNNLNLLTCWSTNPSLPYFFVKSFTEFPSNPSLIPPLHIHQSTVMLFNSLTGVPVAYLDGIILFYLRVAALSGLASSLLSLSSSKTLLMIGGSSNLSFHVSAHRAARPSINSIFIWSPNSEDAQDLIHELGKKEPNYDVKFHLVQKLDEVIGLADIVCCAIPHPVVKGRLLKPGAHLDLVAFASGMKEYDDEVLSKGKVFVDFEVPKDGARQLVDFSGTLTELAGGKKVGRTRKDEVTIFKSLGNKQVDLLAAQFAYESHIKM